LPLSTVAGERVVGEETSQGKQRQAHSAQLKQGLVGLVHFITYIVEDNKKNTFKK
jgi:hypothetical protein